MMYPYFLNLLFPTFQNKKTTQKTAQSFHVSGTSPSTQELLSRPSCLGGKRKSPGTVIEVGKIVLSGKMNGQKTS